MSYNTIPLEADPKLQRIDTLQLQTEHEKEGESGKITSRDFAIRPQPSLPTPASSPQYAVLESNSNAEFKKIDISGFGSLEEPNPSSKLSLDIPKRKGATIIRKTYGKGGHDSGKTNDQKETESRLKTVAALNKYMEGDKSAADALASIARSDGIASDLRMTVWPILLDTHPMAQATAPKGAEQNDNVPLKRIRAEIAKYRRRKKGLPSIRYPSPPTSASPGSLSVASTSTNNSSVSIDSDALDEFVLDVAVEEAVVAFLESHPDVEYSHGMVHVCLALSDWIFRPFGVYDVSDDEQEVQSTNLAKYFDQIMAIMRWTPPQSFDRDEEVCCRRVAHFLITFRRLMPELTAYFDEEEANVPSEEWIHSWIQWWCAKELPTAQKARLWDFYFGYRPSDVPGGISRVDIERVDGDGEADAPLRPVLPGNVNGGDHEAYTPADWHPYVCLALLRASKDELEELELSEIRTLLGHLPAFDMGAILKEAAKLRKEAKELSRREEEEEMSRKGS